MSDYSFSGAASGLAPFRRSLSERALEQLARKVVDRLASGGRDLPMSQDWDHPEVGDVDQLVTALLDKDEDRASDLMRRIQLEGVSLAVLYSRYLAPAAASLGKMWDEDRISFLEVTLGITRIFSLTRALRMNLPPARITKAEPVLFATVPGEHHTMGVEMAATLFRQRGWDVEVMIDATEDQVLKRVKRIKCLILGLSSSGRKTAEALAHLVYSVRALHPEVHIIVSGHIVTAEPDLVGLLHADSAVATVEDALATMDRLTVATQPA